jgi:hypothetical protein
MCKPALPVYVVAKNCKLQSIRGKKQTDTQRWGNTAAYASHSVSYPAGPYCCCRPMFSCLSQCKQCIHVPTPHTSAATATLMSRCQLFILLPCTLLLHRCNIPLTQCVSQPASPHPPATLTAAYLRCCPSVPSPLHPPQAPPQGLQPSPRHHPPPPPSPPRHPADRSWLAPCWMRALASPPALAWWQTTRRAGVQDAASV